MNWLRSLFGGTRRTSVTWSEGGLGGGSLTIVGYSAEEAIRIREAYKRIQLAVIEARKAARP